VVGVAVLGLPVMGAVVLWLLVFAVVSGSDAWGVAWVSCRRSVWVDFVMCVPVMGLPVMGASVLGLPVSTVVSGLDAWSVVWVSCRPSVEVASWGAVLLKARCVCALAVGCRAGCPWRTWLLGGAVLLWACSVRAFAGWMAFPSPAVVVLWALVVSGRAALVGVLCACVCGVSGLLAFLVSAVVVLRALVVSVWVVAAVVVSAVESFDRPLVSRVACSSATAAVATSCVIWWGLPWPSVRCGTVVSARWVSLLLLWVAAACGSRLVLAVGWMGVVLSGGCVTIVVVVAVVFGCGKCIVAVVCCSSRISAVVLE
jgi:hypothetical protein